MKPELLVSSDELFDALVALVRHDYASDLRENLPHCVELQDAMDLISSSGRKVVITGRA